jgi:hypothetical protein
MITQEYLKSILYYDPETGLWVWIKNFHSRRVGKEAGSYTNEGYKRIKIDGKEYRSARLIWFYMTGEWPENLIDHKDTNKTNEKWTNLREATNAEQCRNRNVKSNNISGYKGVKQTTSGKFEASIKIENKYKYLGSFNTPEEAADAYADAAVEAYGEFARFS